MIATGYDKSQNIMFLFKRRSPSFHIDQAERLYGWAVYAYKPPVRRVSASVRSLWPDIVCATWNAVQCFVA